MEGNPQLNKEDFNFHEGAEYPYFTRTVFNNGILGYVDYLDEEHKINGNSIAVGMLGMKFFYMAHDFYAGQFTKTLFPKFDGLNERVALWFISWFNKSSELYQSVLVRHFEEMFRATPIRVPYKDGKVAVDYIDERMRALEAKRIRELETERMRELEAYITAAGFKDCALTIGEGGVVGNFERRTIRWRKYKITELFCVSNSHNIMKSDVVFGSGTIPYVTASSANNSVVARINIDDALCEHGGSIMIGGKTMVVTYQPEKYVSNDSHNLVVSPNGDGGMDEDCGLFVVTAIHKALAPKYSWGDSISKAKIKHDFITLPSLPDGTPDWHTMSIFIQAIKKLCIGRIWRAIKRERRAYAAAVR